MGVEDALEPPSQRGLCVRGLAKRYGRVQAVDQLSFELAPGEIVALLGPNGAGKTTTLLCLAGLVRPEAGTIRWANLELGPRRGRQIALIPEAPEVYEMLTVWEHMVFVARSCRLAGDWTGRAESLLDRFQLGERRDSLGDELSKGMRQKVLLAASILASTPVLLLDEPMMGLDPQAQLELRSILLELREQGTAILVSTHLLENVRSFCDRILILKAGHLQADGTLQELLARSGGRSLEEAFLEIVSEG